MFVCEEEAAVILDDAHANTSQMFFGFCFGLEPPCTIAAGSGGCQQRGDAAGVGTISGRLQ